MEKRSTAALTVGLDLGDRNSFAYVLETTSGEPRGQWRMKTTRAGLAKWFEGREPMRVSVEVGTHSPWVSRLLVGWGHEVLVANPRKVRLIGHNRNKSDRFDGEALARLARLDPALLAPVRHRSAGCQHELAVLRARAALVRTRTLLVNHLRGAVKAVGGRLPSCSTVSLPRQAQDSLPESLRATLAPVLAILEQLSEQIRIYEGKIETLAKQHPEVQRLRQVTGVGPITSLGYVLVIEDPARFAQSRQVGSYLGLTPARRQSGQRDPQLHISKHGDPLLRSLLVQSAHYVLGPFGPDCDLRRHGLSIAQRGGKAAKKRAVIAVARKLAVLLHRLWVSGQVYEPLRKDAVEEPAA